MHIPSFSNKPNPKTVAIAPTVQINALARKVPFIEKLIKSATPNPIPMIIETTPIVTSVLFMESYYNSLYLYWG